MSLNLSYYSYLNNNNSTCSSGSLDGLTGQIKNSGCYRCGRFILVHSWVLVWVCSRPI